MHFISPEWLLLIPAVLLLGMVIKRLHLFQPLRVLAIVIASVLLAKPQYDSLDQSLDLWVLLDRSDSTEELVTNAFPEWKQILQKSKPTKEDTIHYVDFAGEVSIHEPNSERATYTGNTKLTRTQLALEDVLARFKEDRPSRILVFTDGFATEPLHEIAEKLAAKQVPVDFRIVRETDFADFRISKIDLPTQVQVGEPFIIGITVKGHLDTDVPLQIFRNEEQIKETQVKLVNGVAKIEFTTRIQESGSYAFRAKILPTTDAHEGNNASERWVQVTGGPRILLVSNYDNDPLAQVLAKQEYEVDLVSNSQLLRVGQLAGVKSVIFNNVPAHEIPNDFLSALPFYVNEQGGGFMMIGGKRSFAAGGYYQSPIDSLLPISMELKNDHRKLAVALAIVMDRSGSMSMSVTKPGGGTISKMELANNGAAEAIKLLGYDDQIAVYAVDTQPSTVVSLQSIRDKKASLTRKAMKVVSTGGGIYVYNGLNAAWNDLKKSPLGMKHVILFSDAADTKQPGKYKSLIAEMTKQNATISVIGLGTKADGDATLLEDIAKLGNGRIFFTQKPLDIPRLFAQETVTLARSAFITDPTGALPTGTWTEISQDPINWLPSVDSYNLSYARPKASVSLLSQDEYVAPLIAHWRRGMGKVATLAFPLGGEHSKSIREWDGYGDMSQTIVNWLNGDTFPPGLTMRHRLEGTSLTIDLLYDSSEEGMNWTEVFALNPPKIKLQEESGAIYDLSWKRIAPGHYSLNKDLEEGILVKGAIQAGAYALPFGPIKVGSNTEWTFDQERLNELKSLSLQTNGRELIDISKAWVRPEVSFKKGLMIPLCILLILIILADALCTRLGFSLSPQTVFQKKRQVQSPEPEFSFITPAKVTKSKKKKMEQQTPTPSESPEKVVADAPEKEKSVSRSERFAKAKRRR